MIYLKTYFYSEHEVPFLKLNLLEAYPHIDKFLICEFNFTHTGLKREYIWDKVKDQLPQDKMDKVQYIKGDMSDIAKYAYNDGHTIHSINEPWMRGYFVKVVNLKDTDIEWLGEVPEHYKTKKIKHLFRIHNGSTPKSGNSEYWGGSIMWITPADIGHLEEMEIHNSARKITKMGYRSCGTSFLSWPPGTPASKITFVFPPWIRNILDACLTLPG